MRFDLYDKSECSDLLKSIENGSCVIFLGSGLSNGIYPDWESLIRELCENCNVEGLNTNDVIDAETLLIKADEAKSKDPSTWGEGL